MAAANEYALGIGHDLSLAALSGTENYLRQFNSRTPGGVRHAVGVSSQPVDEYPVRELALDGRERGDGIVFHEWNLVLATYGVKALLDTYLSGASVVSSAVTINTRMHMLASFKRYNAHIALPQPGQDITYVRYGVFQVRLRFNDLVAL